MTNITSRTKSAAIISAFGVAAFVCFQNFTSAVAVKGATPPTLTSRNLPSSFWGINIENVYGENFTWASKVASAAI